MRRFNQQAATYDARSGIPVERRSEIVRAFAALSGVVPGDLVLELGAGTGQLGAAFPALGIAYVGLDSSAAMLARFEERRPAGASIRLIQADVDAEWPVQSASVRAVFSSRAVHLFNREHVIGETLRVARAPGATFTLGSVQRDTESLRSVLRRKMRTILVERGFVPRDGDRAQRRMLDAFLAGGGAALGPVVAARWGVCSAPIDVLDAWRRKPGLGGCEPPAPVKAAVLAELRDWAAAHFGSLDARDESEERYILEGVALPAEQSLTGRGDEL